METKLWIVIYLLGLSSLTNIDDSIQNRMQDPLLSKQDFVVETDERFARCRDISLALLYTFELVKSRI